MCLLVKIKAVNDMQNYEELFIEVAKSHYTKVKFYNGGVFLIHISIHEMFHTIFSTFTFKIVKPG